MLNRRRGSCTALVGLLALGCEAGEQSNTPSPNGLTWSSAPEWSAGLDLRIGSVDDSLYALTSFRSMEVGADGSIYTLHSSERVIRRFDADGALLSVFGRNGDGPGEFQSPGPMGWLADTLWVMDYRAYRFSLFATRGDFLTSFAVPYGSTDDPFAVQPPRASGLLFDGTVWGEPPAFSNMVAEGIITHRQLLTMTRSGEVVDTLPAIPLGRNQWAVTDYESERRPSMYREQPFADGPLWFFTASERAIVVVDREVTEVVDHPSFRVSKIGFDGDTIFSVAVSFEPDRIDAAEVDSILDAAGAILGESQFFSVTAARGRELAEATFYRPAHRPGVRDLRPAKDGGIWLSRGPDGAGATEWLALDSNGRPVGRVRLPTNVNPLVIDPPFLWGSETGELDVPYVVRYRMEAP